MTHLLFPGRHLLHTTFQSAYVRDVIHRPVDKLKFLAPPTQLPKKPINSLIFPITSANHQFTRYNPIPFHIRAIGVDRFGRQLNSDSDLDIQIYGIPHYSPTKRFAELILKEIREQSEGTLELVPSNTIVLSSTLNIIEMFQSLDFAILPAEAGDEGTSILRPHDLMRLVVESATDWYLNDRVQESLSSSTATLWQDYPVIIQRVRRLWQDPLLNDQGSISETRNYAQYAYAMGNEAIIELKYADIGQFIKPGRIVDEGCADGALLVRIAADFPDSDLIGIEITGELIARGYDRQRSGEFGDTFVHFHQRNLTQPIFQPASVDTVICNATLHELWSYNEKAKTILNYLHEKYRQLKRGGRLLVRDVVGPQGGEQEVYMWLDDQDGKTTVEQFRTDAIESLSTFGRFYRFAKDFSPRINGSAPHFNYQIRNRDGVNYIVTSLRAAVEFMTKKDYVQNWKSEMNEEFAFWSLQDWIDRLQQVGFTLLQRDSSTHPATHAYTNQWIVENRWQGKVQLYQEVNGKLEKMPYPPTTMVLIAEKPELS